jgi:hypothetical protein
VDPVAISIKSGAKEIKSFSFEDISIISVIDGTAKTITITLPEIINPNELKPTIIIADKAASNPASGVLQDFSKDLSYTITAENGTSQIYKVVLIVTKTCKLKERKYNNQTNFSVDYDARGRIIQENYFLESKPTLTTKYTYNQQNLCTGSVTENLAGAGYVSSKTVNEYSNNKLIKTTIIFEDGRIQNTLFEYDANGSLIKQNQDGNIYTIKGGITTSITISDNIYTLNSAGLTTSIKYRNGDIATRIYDSYNQLIENYYTTSKGLVINRSTYVYNTKRIIKEPQKSYNLGRPIIPGFNDLQVFHYDRINETFYDANTKSDVKYYATYSQELDAKGRLISETSTDYLPSSPPRSYKMSYVWKDCD